VVIQGTTVAIGNLKPSSDRWYMTYVVFDRFVAATYCYKKNRLTAHSWFLTSWLKN